MRRAAVAAAAVAAAVVSGLAGCGSSAEPAVADVRKAVEARLLARRLSFEWVYCLRTPREVGGARIFRCNVNFGEPHIVIYCVTFEGDELVTNREHPEIGCGRGYDG